MSQGKGPYGAIPPKPPPLVVVVYCDSKADAECLRTEFGGSVVGLEAKDWVAVSGRLKGPPVPIRDRIMLTEEISAAGLKGIRKIYPSRTVLSIPAEMAFGTGHHATTATCLRMLVDISKILPKHRWRMLDLGAETGVLGLASRVLGAKSAVGYDFDPVTVDIARKNAEANGINGVRFSKKDVLAWKPGQQFECIAANIFFDTLIAVFPSIAQAMKPDGHLVLSGILKQQGDECLQAAEANGLAVDRVVTIGKWVTAHVRI
jgi:ribosomal protein L11 methyltransferase